MNKSRILLLPTIRLNKYDTFIQTDCVLEIIGNIHESQELLSTD